MSRKRRGEEDGNSSEDEEVVEEFAAKRAITSKKDFLEVMSQALEGARREDIRSSGATTSSSKMFNRDGSRVNDFMPLGGAEESGGKEVISDDDLDVPVSSHQGNTAPRAAISVADEKAKKMVLGIGYKSQ